MFPMVLTECANTPQANNIVKIHKQNSKLFLKLKNILN